MLLFVTPKLLTPSRLGAGRQLVDVTVPEISLTLRGGREVVARTPFPNKNWVLVGRKGNPPTDGLLIDVGEAPDVLTVRTRWAINAETVITHEIAIVVADRRHDIIAGDSALWSTYGSSEWRWDDIRLPWMETVGTIRLDPFMPETTSIDLDTVRGADDTIADGLVIRRRETLDAPTVERERYDWITGFGVRRTSRMPITPINHA